MFMLGNGRITLEMVEGNYTCKMEVILRDISKMEPM